MTEDLRLALVLVHRLAGLDPDGPLVPMQPHETYEQQFVKMIDEGHKHVRDGYLIQALRFT